MDPVGFLRPFHLLYPAMKQSVLLGCLLLFVLPSFSQTVSRLELGNTFLFNGVYAAPDGYLYAASGHNGNTIYQITGSGQIAPFASGIDGPIHMAMNAKGELYVSSFNNQTIYRVRDEGELEAFAVTPIAYPAGMVFGPDGTLYVGHAEPSFGIGGITKVLPDGTTGIHAIRQGIDRPIGMAIDEEGNLYAANAFDTPIYRITPSGEVSLFAHAPSQVFSTTIAYMVFADGYLYAADPGRHQVLRFDMSGEMSVLAGTGSPGFVDGDAAMAQFDRPYGISVSPDGQTLYVASLMAKNHLRTIDLATATDSERDGTLPEFARILPNYPNPFNPATIIPFELDQPTRVRLSVHDMLGRQVALLKDGVLNAGVHEVRFEALELSSGSYWIRLRTADQTTHRLATLLK